MALRLGEHVIRGEIINVKPHSTHGWIELEGQETPLIFELTGDCCPDIKGRRVFFRADPAYEWEKPKPLDPALAKSIQWHQVGPTGTITADDWVRALPCPVEEFVTRARLGEPPPTTWKRHLIIEWFSQNGRVVIELAGAVVENCIRDPDHAREGDDGEWEPLPMTRPKTKEEEIPQEDCGSECEEHNPPASTLDITIIRREGDEFSTERHRFPSDETHYALPGSDSDTAPRQGNPFDDDPHDSTHDTDRNGEPRSGSPRDDVSASLPADLQRILDAAAAETDRRAGIHNPEDDTIAEMELMDHLIETRDGKRLLFFLDHPESLPDPDTLNDRQVEIMLKSLLAELALHNIALHVCRHYTPRDTYRLLLDKILIDCRAHPELRGTGWVQNFMTHEYCKTCDQEAEDEYNVMEDVTQEGGEGAPEGPEPE